MENNNQNANNNNYVTPPPQNSQPVNNGGYQPSAAAIAQEAIQADRKRRRKKRWTIFGVIVGVIIVLSLIASLGNSSEEDGTATNGGSENGSASVGEAPQSDTNNIGDYKVEYVDSYVTDDPSGNHILVVTYSFTNNSDEARSFGYSISDKAYQNGVELGDVYSSYGIDGYDFTTSNSDIKPGVTVEVQEAYELYDETTPVELELSRYLSDNVDYTYTINL